MDWRFRKGVTRSCGQKSGCMCKTDLFFIYTGSQITFRHTHTHSHTHTRTHYLNSALFFLFILFYCFCLPFSLCHWYHSDQEKICVVKACNLVINIYTICIYTGIYNIYLYFCRDTRKTNICQGGSVNIKWNGFSFFSFFTTNAKRS